MIELNCPHCGHQMRMEKKHAGRRGACKYCHGRFQIPTGEGPVPGWTPQVQPAILADSSRGGEGLGEVHEAAPSGRPEGEFEGPGFLFWGLAILVPPAALLWALLMPKAHPAKKAALFVPAVLTVLAAALTAAIVVAAGPPPVLAGGTPRAGAGPVPAFDDETPTFALKARYEEVPIPEGLRLSPAQAFEDLVGPLAEVKVDLLSCEAGDLSGNYFDVQRFYEAELRRLGWMLDITYSFDGVQGRFTTLDAEKHGRALFVKLVEIESGVRVVIVTRR